MMCSFFMRRTSRFLLVSDTIVCEAPTKEKYARPCAVGTVLCSRHIEVTGMPKALNAEPRRSMNEPGCTTIREVLARVGDKWSVFVITLLGERTMRFTELQRSIEGISQRMLTLTLRQLERDGLVERVVYPVVPPRVEYSLTALGTTLLEPVVAIARWADVHRPEIEEARAEDDA